ncbi:MAG: purine-nucleoside phosphorylase, partial [Clostridium sp.]
EVIVANHSSMKVLGISCITNMACGILDQPLSHSEVIETSKKVHNNFKKLISGIIKSI